MRNKKGQVSIFIVFMISVITVILIATVFAPFGAKMNTEFYVIGEKMILDQNKTLSKIQNLTVRNTLSDINSKALNSIQNNIEVNTAMFTYSWIFVISLSAMVVFLFTRRIIEFSGGGFI